jgi:hypothetical protein
MVDLAELARNLTVDVGNDGLNGLRDSFPVQRVR